MKKGLRIKFLSAVLIVALIFSAAPLSMQASANGPWFESTWAAGLAWCKQWCADNNSDYYSTHGWENNYWNSYWGQVAGHNCTNYVAYMLQKKGVGNFFGGGNAHTWDDHARNAGYRVDNTPAVGAIAVWENDYYGQGLGHVAFVEQIVDKYNGILVSEDGYTDEQTDLFAYRFYVKGTSGWPDHFIHAKDGPAFDKSSSTGSEPSAATITEGDYYLRNGSKYLACEGDWNWADAMMVDAGSSAWQFKAYKNGAGYNFGYKGNSNHVLNVITTSSSKDGDQVTLWERTNDNSQIWKLEKKGDGYLLHPADNWSLAATVSANGKIFVKTSKGTDDQIWYLDKEQKSSVIIPTELHLNATESKMFVGDEEPLECYISPAHAEYKILWESSNPAIVSVTSGGYLRALAPGSAVITATATINRKLSATCIVTVVPRPDQAGAVTFTDVKESDYYYWPVSWAAKYNITTGTGNGKFSPNDPCTRSQAVTFLWRAKGSPEPRGTGTSFSDVKPDTYYAKAVQWAVENKITTGTGNGKFSPDAPCTRAQIVTFLYRYSGSPATSVSGAFNDVDPKEYYANAVSWAVSQNITTGTGNGKFSPVNTCTRGQIVTFLYRNRPKS